MNNFSAKGTITKLSIQEIPSKVQGGTSRQESRIEIQLLNSDDDPKLETFAGETQLIDRFQVGQKVKITATTSSGRHIKKIIIIDEKE